MPSSAGAKGQRVGNGGNSLCFSVVEPTLNLSPSSSAEGLDRPAIQSPIGAAMLALMLSVPVKVEAQAAYNVLSVKHLAKIRGGLLHAATSAVPWAILHERTFEHDVMVCWHCGGRLRSRAMIVDPGGGNADFGEHFAVGAGVGGSRAAIGAAGCCGRCRLGVATLVDWFVLRARFCADFGGIGGVVLCA